MSVLASSWPDQMKWICFKHFLLVFVVNGYLAE